MEDGADAKRKIGDVGENSATARRQRRRQLASRRAEEEAAGDMYTGTVDGGGNRVGRLAEIEEHDGAEGAADIDPDDEGEDEDADAAVKRMHDEVEGEEPEDPNERFNEVGELIEPFNLRSERANDGFFDANGNFVWRKGEEPDEWLAQLEQPTAPDLLRTKKKKRGDEEEEEEEEEAEEDYEAKLTAPQIESHKREIVMLLVEGESVVVALRRLGKDLKKAPEAQRAAFDRLTELADALIGSGKNDIYSTTREVLCTVDPRAFIADPLDEREWEYRTSDGTRYGPYSTQHILSWRAQGFFTGETAVPMRRVVVVAAAVEEAATNLADDLMNDMDEDDDEEQPEEPPKEEEVEQKWELSDDIDFTFFASTTTATTTAEEE